MKRRVYVVTLRDGKNYITRVKRRAGMVKERSRDYLIKRKLPSMSDNLIA